MNNISELKQTELLTIREEKKSGGQGDWEEKDTSPFSVTVEGQKVISETRSKNTDEPTSIPSPFARLALAEIAFKAASEISWDELPKRYQKIVSNCLDVAEIFFNYNRYKDAGLVKVIKWDRKTDLESVKDTIFAKTLTKFLEADKAQYNFDGMDAIYLLKYCGGSTGGENRIIGATSPITLFFSVDNDLSYVAEKIHFSRNNKPFDKDEFYSLEKRDPEFIRYFIEKLPMDLNSFGEKFGAVNAYIHRVEKDVSIDENNDRYVPIIFGENDVVEIFKQSLYCRDETNVRIESDFQIKANSVTPIPLVLPTAGSIYKNCNYTDSNLQFGDNFAPECDQKELNERILPGTNIKYPYLTLSDFLEDKAIMMPYEQNNDAYFSALTYKPNGGESVSFLLPIKKKFFEYFSVDDLLSENKNDKPTIEMKYSWGTLEVLLNIPISGNKNVKSVEYRKEYKTTDENLISDVRFGLGLFPIIRCNNIELSDYRVALFDKFKGENIELSFYNEHEKIPEDCHRIVSNKENRRCSVETYVLHQKRFDRIDVKTSSFNGVIIPIFKKEENNKNFIFAVDFGTTNTHIAYRLEGDKSSKSFDSNKPQMIRFHKNYPGDVDIRAAFENSYIPDKIGREEEKTDKKGGAGEKTDKYSFPIRSAFAVQNNIDYKHEVYTLCDGYIPFRYEKTNTPNYVKLIIGENLKWASTSNDENKKNIELFIKNIAFMLHNKVLLEDGNLEQTEIRWFYPISMPPHLVTTLSTAWIKSCKEYFGEKVKVKKILESVAPFIYYKKNGGGTEPIVTIDVGGGTTDVYVKQDDNNKYVMSFRFASNSIFGDGYNSNIEDNGFVKKYKDDFDKELKEDPIEKAKDEIYNKGVTSDFISFLFSLASPDRPSLNFMEKLKSNQNLKYVFLIFYAAIIYHIAKFMKAKELKKPLTVCFSGNGSKTLQVLSEDEEILEKFIKTIFEKVYGEKYSKTEGFCLKYNTEQPKEATAKGGLIDKDEKVSDENKSVLLGIDDTTIATEENCFDNISEDMKEKIVESVGNFINFLFRDLNKEFCFYNQFGTNPNIVKEVVEIANQNLKQYLDDGIEKAKEYITNREEPINETLFFYPIVGMLNKLAQKLGDKK
ncbi:hypothetical protein J5690_07180 [bacterium]|nr:hypothetical protein [bacterium]